VVAGVCLAITLQGWCLGKINILLRAAFAVVVWLLLDTSLVTDIYGLILLAALVAQQFVSRSRQDALSE
jgi:TRAP-type uncharacterized transport system fused permease subunit